MLRRDLLVLAVLASRSSASPADDAFQLRGSQEDFDYISSLPRDQQHEALKRLRSGEPRPGGTRHPSLAHTRSVASIAKRGGAGQPQHVPPSERESARKPSCRSPPTGTPWGPPSAHPKAAADAPLPERAGRIEAAAEAALAMLARYYGEAADNVLNQSWVLQPSGVADWAAQQAAGDVKDLGGHEGMGDAGLWKATAAALRSGAKRKGRGLQEEGSAAEGRGPRRDAYVARSNPAPCVATRVIWACRYRYDAGLDHLAAKMARALVCCAMLCHYYAMRAGARPAPAPSCAAIIPRAPRHARPLRVQVSRSRS